MQEPNGGTLRWRVEQVEKRVENIDEHGSRQMDVLKNEIRSINERIEQLSAEVKRNTNTVMGAAVTVAVTAVGFAITVLIGLK